LLWYPFLAPIIGVIRLPSEFEIAWITFWLTLICCFQ
jgi:hypothetical protein